MATTRKPGSARPRTAAPLRTPQPAHDEELEALAATTAAKAER